MKVLYIIFVVIALLFVASQIYFMIYDSKIETHEYEVVDTFGDVEIRKYEPALMASVTVEGDMFSAQNKAFGRLAEYIFGGNAENKKIAMTAPVQMRDEGAGSEMKFMIPKAYSKEELPQPNDEAIRLMEQESYYVLAIEFGGFSSKARFEKYKKKLAVVIEKQNLEPIDDYFFQGYNAPYQLLGRKNEVLIKIRHHQA